MKSDKLVICDLCGSDACYNFEINDKIQNWSCLGCGFQTNTLMKKDEPFFEENLKAMPELHKEIIQEGKDGKMWFPQTINVEDLGMVFADGTSSKNWKWSAVKVKKFSMENKEEFKVIGQEDKYYPHKTDMSTKKQFEPGDFMSAIFHLDLLPDLRD
tara:strand:+ start:1573 stop:2043 length:471 start_codon:yes stop_codon:yes gene_type:complete